MENNRERLAYKDLHEIAVQLKRIGNLLRIIADQKSNISDVEQMRRAIGLPDEMEDDFK